MLFWDFTQRILVVCHRRFGTSCRSHLQGSRRMPGVLSTRLYREWCGRRSTAYLSALPFFLDSLTLKYGTDRLSRNVGNKLPFKLRKISEERRRQIKFWYVTRTITTVQRKTNSMHNLFLVYFVNLHMFRAYPGPSSARTTICIQQLVFIILFR